MCFLGQEKCPTMQAKGASVSKKQKNNLNILLCQRIPLLNCFRACQLDQSSMLELTFSLQYLFEYLSGFFWFFISIIFGCHCEMQNISRKTRTFWGQVEIDTFPQTLVPNILNWINVRTVGQSVEVSNTKLIWAFLSPVALYWQYDITQPWRSRSQYSRWQLEYLRNEIESKR